MKTQKCSKHTKYTGRKLPKYKCYECLSYYNKLHTAPRIEIKVTIVIDSKKTYKRKGRHCGRACDEIY